MLNAAPLCAATILAKVEYLVASEARVVWTSLTTFATETASSTMLTTLNSISVILYRIDMSRNDRMNFLIRWNRVQSARALSGEDRASVLIPYEQQRQD